MPARRPAQLVAALAAMGAAIVHAVVAVDHWQVWWGYGAMFVAAVVFQLVWGMSVAFSRHRALLLVGILGNLGAVGMWTLTRTAGQPVGPAAGVAEPLGYPGVLTVFLEILAVVAAASLWAGSRARQVSVGRQLLTTGAGGVVVVAATGFAVGTTLSGHQHGTTGGPGSHHPAAEQENGHHDEPGAPDEREETSGPVQTPPNEVSAPPDAQTSTDASPEHEHSH